MDLPFYWAFSTGIYLFKISNKNRTTFCKICPNLTRKAPDQIREIKFLQMYLFSILSTLWIYHFQCYYMSSLPLYVSSHLDSLHRHGFPTIFAFPRRFSTFPSWFPLLHSHPIVCIPSLILPISLTLFPNYPFSILQVASSACNL